MKDAVLIDKKQRSLLRLRYKQAVHQKAPSDAFRLAMMASQTLREAGMSPEKALAEAGQWLCAHGKGPTVNEWKRLVKQQRELVASSTMDAQEQLVLFHFTHFLVLAVANWKRHLRTLPHIVDVVIGTTFPILAQTQAVPVSMKLSLIEQVEAVLSRHNKSPGGRCKLAELRMVRGKMLMSMEDESAIDDGRHLLEQQESIVKQLARQGVEGASELLNRIREELG